MPAGKTTVPPPADAASSIALLIAAVSTVWPSPRAPNFRTSKRASICAPMVAAARHADRMMTWTLRMADLLRADRRPDRTVRVAEGVPRVARDRAAVAGRLGRHVAPAAHDDGIDEMLVEVIDELGDAVVHPSRHREAVPHRQVLDQLAEPDAAGVRADRDAELRGHEDHRQVLVHAAEPAAVDLAEADRVGLEELLEEDAVRA